FAAGRLSVDYRRPFAGGFVERSKRITPLSRERNRIERFYAIHGSRGELVANVEMQAVIRTFRPAELEQLMRRHGFGVKETCWDYGEASGPSQAQFVTMVGSIG